jgi:hypothetical protein
MSRRVARPGWRNRLVEAAGRWPACEVIGGYALVEVKSKEEALQVARQFMELHRLHWPAFEGECEVRPFDDQ